ncbi:MAG: hypothetical protein A2096_13170 [Spirochaetes bacterium GWF1_41_5]|nr:MAG: hypothetical protein A2096_13170 [Spirochaetes bacterium GWF1_41_5]
MKAFSIKSAKVARKFSLLYECAVNPAYPMPDALNTVKKCLTLGIITGIISNAQFFTPCFLSAFFSTNPAHSIFDPDFIFTELGQIADLLEKQKKEP